MAFRVPQHVNRMQMMQPTNVQQPGQQTGMPQRGSVAQSEGQPAPFNPLQTAQGMIGAYNAGETAYALPGKVSNFYSRMTMPSGVNPASVMAGSGPQQAGSAFLGPAPGLTQMAPAGTPEAVGQAGANLFSGSAGGNFMTPALYGADGAAGAMAQSAFPTIGAGADGAALLGGGADAAGAGASIMSNSALAGGAMDAGAAAAGSAAAEGGMLAGASSLMPALGPVGLGAAGIYGLGSLMKWW